MLLNVYERFRGAIVNTLVDYPIFSNMKITNKKDLIDVLKIQSKTNSGFTVKDIEKVTLGDFRDIDTKKINFDNKITFVESKLTFYDNKLDSCNLSQLFLTKKDEDRPFINITMFENIPSNFFRDIKKRSVVLDIGGCYTISYETYIDKKTNEVLKEEYRRNYHYENYDINDHELLKSLDASSNTLIFRYHNGYVDKVLIDDTEQKSSETFTYFVSKEIEDKIQEIYKILDLELVGDKQINNNPIKRKIKDIY